MLATSGDASAAARSARRSARREKCARRQGNGQPPAAAERHSAGGDRADQRVPHAAADSRNAERRLPAERLARPRTSRRSPAATSRSAWTDASWLPRCPEATTPILAERLRSTGVSAATLGRDDYAVLPRPLIAGATTGPVALILRSRTEQLLSLTEIQTGLAVTAVVAVLLATLLSFAVARTITRPLAAITDVMREVARHRRPDAQDHARRRTALARRGCRTAGDDVQHADRVGRAYSARDVAEGTAVRRSAACPRSSRTRCAIR